MLLPHELTVGPINTATAMTLVLPRDAHEATMLITDAPGTPTAIFLDGEYRFDSMGTAESSNWGGILIPNVALEIDEKSVADPAIGRPRGALIRKQTLLCIVTQQTRHSQRAILPLVTGLPPCHENESASFTRWRIMIGEGLNRRELKAIDALKN